MYSTTAGLMITMKMQDMSTGWTYTTEFTGVFGGILVVNLVVLVVMKSVIATIAWKKREKRLKTFLIIEIVFNFL